MNPAIGLNAKFAKGTPKPGNVAFLSQSGALLTAILDWSQREEVGFSGNRPTAQCWMWAGAIDRIILR